MTGRGRPSLGKRVGIGFRVTPETKARIDRACAVSGRSQSQEIELRLQQAFLLEDLLKARLVSRELLHIFAD